ncbi:MAG: NADH-quinone oxidoreductase subunit M, partial [Desulfovibrionaceae bacterium]
MVASVFEMVLGLPLLWFSTSTGGFQFVERIPWVEAWGLEYHLGLDGISLLRVVLTLFVLPLCVMCSWTYIGKRIK